MALYELRTCTLYVGKMAEATKLYTALEKGGHHKKPSATSRVTQGRSISSCTCEVR